MFVTSAVFLKQSFLSSVADIAVIFQFIRSARHAYIMILHGRMRTNAGSKPVGVEIMRVCSLLEKLNFFGRIGCSGRIITSVNPHVV